MKTSEINKLTVLINYVSSDVYQLFSEAQTFDEAVTILKALYVKTPNEIYARHALSTRKQQPNESIDEYLQVLKVMSKDCNYVQVSASQYRDEAVRDAFISGLQSSLIRQRLLENRTLDLETACNQARSLESAKKSSDSYLITQTPNLAAASTTPQSNSDVVSELTEKAASAATSKKCYFCGLKYHPRSPECSPKTSSNQAIRPGGLRL